MSSELIDSLKRALHTSPEDLSLRLHLARLLIDTERLTEALAEVNETLRRSPQDKAAARLLRQLAARITAISRPSADTASGSESAPETRPHRPDDIVTLAEVGGLAQVKRRITESFLGPLGQAGAARTFEKPLSGGLLLYGPPGCGKTFIARAIAGELGARFISVTITDILSRYAGDTQKNLQAAFEQARDSTPTVLFLDEIDGFGMKRSEIGGGATWLRQLINQLLLEMDSMAGNNEGLYILAATNHPWDLDDTLLRPGRLDRMLLVPPPDAPARKAVLLYHFSSRPVAGIDLDSIGRRSEGFSGTDLQRLATTAAEKAMAESIATGNLQPITMVHVEEAFDEVRPSTDEWVDAARAAAQRDDPGGKYNELRDYLGSPESA